jgi:PadR family transcriptional regulator PadR
MLVLHLLSGEERYGYELTTLLEERTGGEFAVTGGTLYPVLYRLEDAGHVEPRWQTPARGSPRKYYRLTGDGSKELERLTAEWRAFTDAVERLLGDPHRDEGGDG